MTVKFDVLKHALVPHHEILSEDETRGLFDRYRIKPEQLPKIYASDPVARRVHARPGQILKIIRDSETAGKGGAIAFRLVVEG